MSTEQQPYGEPETRRRILQAAWDVLEQRGPGVSVGEIAQIAGVSRQAVYLHFGDRAALFVAVVDHIDESLGSADMRANVFSAPSGVESLRRWIETISWYTQKIDVVSYFLEAAQYQDAALRAAWRNRMGRRQDMIRTIVDRIAEEGGLAEGWDPANVSDLVYAVTMPGAWRELCRELRWTPETYADRVHRMIEHAFLRGGPGT